LSGIIYVLAHLTVGSSLFPLFFLFLKSTAKINLFIKVLTLEFVIVNFLNLFLFHFTNLDQSNLFSLHILTEDCLIFLIFREIYKSHLLTRKLFMVIIISNIVFFLVLLSFSAIERLNIFSNFSTILMLFTSIVILIYTYKKSLCENLFDDFTFNFSIAILINNGLQLYISFFNSIILKRADDLFLYTWPIVQISSILYYLLISRAIWKLKN
jgi:hypothetical protein